MIMIKSKIWFCDLRFGCWNMRFRVKAQYFGLKLEIIDLKAIYKIFVVNEVLEKYFCYYYCQPEGPYIYKVLDRHKVMFILTR